IMPPKSAPLTQAAIHRMIKESVDAAIIAERARQVNAGNDARCECAGGKKVKFATATIQGPTLTWWNAKVATMGLETTVHMIMPSKDNLYNGRKGIGFENLSYFEKAIDLRPTLYDEKIIFEDHNFQEIINPDFKKIDSSFQQTSSLKPYVPNVILKKIIIDLEDEVVNLLEKEKANLETIESLKSKGCSKHMTGNRALLTNFVEKFLGMVRFGNNDFAVIDGYGDVVIGSMMIKKVYYDEGLGHNLFSVGQFCDKGLEVAF
nr:integrase, catalytic region, zinc finger, CCHC-type, peptidase aspartic, catalytic [Tanacetum cinerariifolium]